MSKKTDEKSAAEAKESELATVEAAKDAFNTAIEILIDREKAEQEWLPPCFS